MRFCHTLPLVLVLGLAACSGESSKEVTFSDPVAAMDQADAAGASGNSETALAGYEYALANGDAALQGDALMGMLSLHLADGKEDEATSAFDRLKNEFSDSLTSDELLRLCDAAVAAAFPDLGESMVEFAAGKFPEIKSQLEKPLAAFELIREQGPGADLSGVGYAGD
ncbi:MAG: hypothetical protein ACPG31_01470 [Planctomycetota bacterium]